MKDGYKSNSRLMGVRGKRVSTHHSNIILFSSNP
jgi:hypothetical protein